MSGKQNPGAEARALQEALACVSSGKPTGLLGREQARAEAEWFLRRLKAITLAYAEAGVLDMEPFRGHIACCRREALRAIVQFETFEDGEKLA
jgi:hypothetical protein